MSPQRPKHRIFTRLKLQGPPTGQRHNVLRLGLTSVWNMLIHWLWKYQPYITLPHAPNHIIYIWICRSNYDKASEVGTRSKYCLLWEEVGVIYSHVFSLLFTSGEAERHGPAAPGDSAPTFVSHLSRGTLTVSPKASVMKELGLSQTAFWSLPVLTWCNHCRNDSRSWKIAFNLMTVYYGYVDGSSFILIMNWK